MSDYQLKQVETELKFAEHAVKEEAGREGVSTTRLQQYSKIQLIQQLSASTAKIPVHPMFVEQS